MIIGIGTDIIEVHRIQEKMQFYSEKQLLRIFTHQELDYSFASKNKFERLAVRFAAKEAVYKAFGKGVFSHNQIEVVLDNDSKPQIQFHEKTLQRWEGLGCPNIHVALSHTQTYAIATVIFEN